MKGSDLAAGDFVPGISGGLGSEVVRSRVDHNRFAEDLADGESVGEKNLKRASVISEQGRKITGMIRVREIFGVIMGQRICKGIVLIFRAATALVNVKAEKTAARGIWKSGDLCGHENTALCLIKIDVAGQIGMVAASAQSRPGMRPLLELCDQAHKW